MFDVNPTALKFHHADLERSVRNAREPREIRRSPRYSTTVAVIISLVVLMIALPTVFPAIGA
ncbi:hypothetical protein ACFFUT_03640 [Pseudohalocynthiibacter aestuariivivens]|uniref:Uncharacterized protein n=1 Tax=Pseudohalocynthiibacter aestuariivivens TaxID=1591409 RepID=A0ABV5JBP5_9RHOB|nr:hypothetical protein [Pseudohalocynthiibacter aestuariivivens]MBS9718833.1 hypothetical protein [Pseudohalocynthiibacter aestuariivivens]